MQPINFQVPSCPRDSLSAELAGSGGLDEYSNISHTFLLPARENHVPFPGQLLFVYYLLLTGAAYMRA